MIELAVGVTFLGFMLWILCQAEIAIQKQEKQARIDFETYTQLQQQKLETRVFEANSQAFDIFLQKEWEEEFGEGRQQVKGATEIIAEAEAEFRRVAAEAAQARAEAAAVAERRAEIERLVRQAVQQDREAELDALAVRYDELRRWIEFNARVEMLQHTVTPPSLSMQPPGLPAPYDPSSRDARREMAAAWIWPMDPPDRPILINQYQTNQSHRLRQAEPPAPSLERQVRDLERRVERLKRDLGSEDPPDDTKYTFGF